MCAMDAWQKKMREHRRRKLCTLALATWTAFCEEMTALRLAVLQEKPEAWATAFAPENVASAIAVLRTHFLCPSPKELDLVSLMRQRLPPHAAVTQHMRRWAQAQVATLYGALAFVNGAYRLDRRRERLFASMLTENALSGTLLYNCLDPALAGKSIFDDRRMCDCVLPPWSTAIVPGATMLDPYLGLRRLRGPVTYTYLEPKPEWRARLPHLPILVLLGDWHEPKPPCADFDLGDDGTKEVGGTQSFWHFLDTDHALAAYTRDVVLELWVPKHLRVPTVPPRSRSRVHVVVSGGPLVDSRAFLVDCVGQDRRPTCPLRSVRVHVADLRNLSLEVGFRYEHLYGQLHLAVRHPPSKLDFVNHCRALHLDPQHAVRSLLSLDIATDLDDPALRRERLAHEFYQLEECVRAQFRDKLGRVTQQRYPYDLPGAVAEWMLDAGKDPLHPRVQRDTLEFLDQADTRSNRRIMAVELYALSRVLKKSRHDDAVVQPPRLAIFFAGAVHCMTAAYLVHDMYSIHGAAASPVTSASGCLNFSRPTDACFREVLTFGACRQIEYVFPEPQRPLSWAV